MRNNNSYVEAILTTGTRDFGFFDMYYNIEKQHHFQGKPLNNKPKSIVMSNKSMYVCQFVQDAIEMEMMHKLDWDSMNVSLQLTAMPDTTRYRLATEELWLFLMVAHSWMDKQNMHVVNRRIKRSKDTDIYYDEYRNGVYCKDGSYAPWPEIVLALSHEYTVSI